MSMHNAGKPQIIELPLNQSDIQRKIEEARNAKLQPTSGQVSYFKKAISY